MPRFDRNKRYVNRKGQRFGKGVWYDDNGKILQPGFGRFEDSSRIDRTVTQYNTDGTISTFSWEDWVKKNGIDHELRVLQNDRKYAIPFIPDKKVTISIDKNSPTRKNDGAVFSENLLDSIAINAKKAGLSFGDALGIVAQESTFGNGNHRGTGQTLLPWLPVLNQSSGEQKDKAEKMPYQGFQSPSLLISNWKQREENPYAEFFYDGKGDVLHTSKSKEYYDEYFRPHLVKGNRYHLQEESPLQHGFRNYKEHPKSWNYGDSDYQNKITVQKKELTQYSPEIREYMRKHGLHAYGGPLVEQANMFEIGGPKKKLSDKEYYSIMEKVAENNNPIWNSQRIKNGGRPLSVDEEYLRILNDNTYDYRGFYDNNPIDAADASTHWPDSYKTVYHPTFSTYSDYSGKVSDFNPLGLEGGTWPKGPTEAREEDFIPAWWQSIPNAYTGRQHDKGGSLNAYKSWDNLSIKEKSEMMKVAIRNGITNLADIKAKYNEFAEGGYMTSEEDDDVNMYDGISQTSQQMQQRYIYDILPRLYAMDGVNVVLSSGLRPNAVVYQNGKPTGRKSRHGSGQAADIVPVKGTTFADIFRVLHDPNSNVSRWMRANNAGYVDETSATGTTKYWHDHNRDHSHVHHQIGGNPASQYAARFGNSVSSVGNYRDIAKQHIRQNEGWSATPYADGPNGWRSVGYGFNDSGFRAKYPGGIANYYAQRGGITKAEAERELDWFLNNMEASLRKTYGRRWDSFSDNQKAAIMDTAYQRPASVDAKSAFYAAVMSGNPNAGNLLGVKGFDKRNADRRNLFSSSAVQAMNPQNYGQQQPQMAYNPFEGWEPMNPQAFYGNPEQMGVIEQLAQQNAQMQAILDKQEADRLLAVQQQAEAEEKALQRNRTNLALQMVGMMGSDDGSSEFDMLRPLLGNMSAYGGHLYDGWTEPTGLMNRKRLDDIQDLNNNILDFEKNASSNNNGFSTITDAETGEVGQIMGITPDGTYRTVYPSGTYNMTLDLPNTDVLGSKARMKAVRGLDAPLVGGELKDNQYRTMPTNSEADAFADAWTEQTAPTVGHLISAGLKPLDLITPSRYVGLLDSDNKDGFLHLFNDNNRGFFIGNDPTKPFSKQFHDEHPILAGIGNMAGDVSTGYGIKKLLDSTKGLYYSLIREPISFSEKQAATQRMEDLIHSADYVQKQKYAGLTDAEIHDFQDMVSRRLNGGDFPAYYSRISSDGMSLVLPKPIGGIYMKRGLSPEDFLNAFDHEVAHYSTANIGRTGNAPNGLLGWVNNVNPATVEKIMDYNSNIIPFRPKADALKIRKDRGLRTSANWLNKPRNQELLNYFQNDQEVRSNAYAILQDAKRRGMSVEEYVDFCTSPGNEIYMASPKPIKYLNYVFTP